MLPLVMVIPSHGGVKDDAAARMTSVQVGLFKIDSFSNYNKRRSGVKCDMGIPDGGSFRELATPTWS